MKNFKVIHLMILAIISSTELIYPIIFTGPVRRNIHRHERELAYENGFVDGSRPPIGEEEYNRQLTDYDENSRVDEDSTFDLPSDKIYVDEPEAMIQGIQNYDENINVDENSDRVNSDTLLVQDIQVDPTMLPENYSDDANTVITQAMSNDTVFDLEEQQDMLNQLRKLTEQQDILKKLSKTIKSRLQRGGVATQAIVADNNDNFDDNNFDSYQSDAANTVITQAMSEEQQDMLDQLRKLTEQQDILKKLSKTIRSRLQRGGVATQAIVDDNEDSFDDNNFDSYPNEDYFAAIQAIKEETEHQNNMMQSIEETKGVTNLSADQLEQKVVTPTVKVAATIAADQLDQKVVTPIVNALPVEETKAIPTVKDIHIPEVSSAKSASVIGNIESPIAESKIVETSHQESAKIVKVYPVYDAMRSAMNHIKSATLDMYNYLFNRTSTPQQKNAIKEGK